MLMVWGSNGDGQLGLGKNVTSLTSPTPLDTTSLLDSTVVDVACGYHHTLAVTESGEVLSWGEGESGKLGLGDDSSSWEPRVVGRLEAGRVAAGGQHSLAITWNGQVYGWGSNEKGQLGLGSQPSTPLPTLLSALSDHVITAVSAGESHSAFLTDKGELLFCGEARQGQLGVELTPEQESFIPRPFQIPKLVSLFVSQVSCGGCHTMVLASPKTEQADEVITETIDSVTIGKALPPLARRTSNANLLTVPEQPLSPLPLSPSIPYLANSSVPVPLSPDSSSSSPTHAVFPQIIPATPKAFPKVNTNQSPLFLHSICMQHLLKKNSTDFIDLTYKTNMRSRKDCSEDSYSSDSQQESGLHGQFQNEPATWVQTCQIVETDSLPRYHAFYTMKKAHSYTDLSHSYAENWMNEKPPEQIFPFQNTHSYGNSKPNDNFKSCRNNQTFFKQRKTFTICDRNGYINSPRIEKVKFIGRRRRQCCYCNNRITHGGGGDTIIYNSSSDEDENDNTNNTQLRLNENGPSSDEIEKMEELEIGKPQALEPPQTKGGKISRFFSRLKKSPSQNLGINDEINAIKSNGKVENDITFPMRENEDSTEKKSKMCTIL